LHVSLVSADYLELLENPAVDAVAICSYSKTHPQIIVDAAAAGKHIFCEKPVGFELEQIDQALRAVERAGVKLQVGFNRRFDPGFRHAHEMVAAGKVGNPHILRITSRDPELPHVEYLEGWGGLLLETTIHDFDMARYLVGSEVVELYVAGDALINPLLAESGHIDTAIVTLRFENGAIGTIDNSLQAVYGYDQRVEVFGSQGMVTVGNSTPDSHIYWDKDGLHSAKPLFFFLERYLDSYLIEMQAFIKAIRTDTQPPVTGLDGRIPVVMCLAAMKSLREKRPVALKEIES
jgi:myo-inositol 2-dehydrogenase/D-chiro-inositol 1-dehydrogenase